MWYQGITVKSMCFGAWLLGFVPHSCHLLTVKPWAMCLTLCACCLHLMNGGAKAWLQGLLWSVIKCMQTTYKSWQVAVFYCSYSYHHHHCSIDFLQLGELYKQLDKIIQTRLRHIRTQLSMVIEYIMKAGERVYWRQCKYTVRIDLTYTQSGIIFSKNRWRFII